MKKKWMGLLCLLAGLLCLCGFDADRQKVYDGAGILEAEEEEELQAQAAELAQELQLDVILVTTEDTEGLTTARYNEEFYNRHGFGYEGPGGSGVQFLIDMEHRQYYLLTAGEGDPRYTDAEIEKMYDQIAPSMEEGDYAGACFQFLEAAARYGEPAQLLSAGRAAVLLVGSAAVAGIVVAVLVWQSKRKAEGAWRRGYMGNRAHMNRQQDRFLHTTVVRTRIPRPQNHPGARSSGPRGGPGGGGPRGGGGHSRGGGRCF